MKSKTIFIKNVTQINESQYKRGKTLLKKSLVRVVQEFLPLNQSCRFIMFEHSLIRV